MAHKDRVARTAYEKKRYEDPARKTLTKQRNAEIRRRNKTFIYGYKATHPCIVCGETDPIVLEFDHRDPSNKRRNICEMIATLTTIETLQAEIAKCDVLCANCHRRKTAKQLGWRLPPF